jgi:predicted RNA-binding Zn-ribbon protein involved in translation (DUF1610 family)
MQSVETGTLAGAGSFHCESCGFAIALHETDEVPGCPGCGGRTFKRSSLFSTAHQGPARGAAGAEPDWVGEARRELGGDAAHLAFDCDGGRRVVALEDGWRRVGRSLSADVRLDDPTVSRRHGLIFRGGGEAKVLDDRSLNGVFVNGERVEAAELRDGDTVSVGRFHLHFIEPGPGGRRAPRPRAAAG